MDSNSQRPIVGFVQARMASTRLPGKVLADINGEPMLARVVARVSRAATLNELVVATGVEGADDPIVGLCEALKCHHFRGSDLDVLDRIYQAARVHNAQTVVRLTADCPLIDPNLIDQTVRAYLDSDPQVDFAANRLPNERTYPVGTDTEVCSIEALARAWGEAAAPHQREHVMPYLYENPDRFHTLVIHADEDYSRYRWTVDTLEDLELVRRIYAQLGEGNDFGWKDVLELFDRDPSLATMNAAVQHRTELDLDPGWGA